MAPERASSEALVASIFSPALAEPASGAGKGWRVTNVARGIAKFFGVEAGAFSLTLDGKVSEMRDNFSMHVIFVQAGTLVVGQWSHQRTLNQGDIFVSCNWLPIALESKERFAALIIELPAWWAVNRLMKPGQILPDLHVGSAFFAVPVISRMTTAILDLEDGVDVPVGLEMLADMLRVALTACSDPLKARSKAVGRMGQILGFILDKIDKPGLSAQDAAAALKVSVRTIYKTCAEHGTSFAGLATEMRLFAAEHHLLRTNDRISQIAYALGFASLAHFSRLFKVKFGTPANLYRQHHAAKLANAKSVGAA